MKNKKEKYTGSIVLGLNDALVEITGALVGLTLILQDTRLIAITGGVTGIAASLSMAASEYLQVRNEESVKTPTVAATYTGIAYISVVCLLILPFVIYTNPFISLAHTLVIALLVIAGFTYYVSTIRKISFRKRFFEMAVISLGVAAVVFLIGLAAQHLFGL